ncbi:hypothetical protein FOL46_009021 [Perkinsus olseni]|uniref:EF-hand domain-containing protein n=1 Tax=Perkinsus olseni TaxID=32597 RepID=A0A7J6MLB4_PEROL|nr:hypothetical protein FOL46_009021 [Perkinsus olseni]
MKAHERAAYKTLQLAHARELSRILRPIRKEYTALASSLDAFARSSSKYLPAREKLRLKAKRRHAQLLEIRGHSEARKQRFRRQLDNANDKTMTAFEASRDSADSALMTALENARASDNPHDGSTLGSMIKSRTKELESILKTKLPRYTSDAKADSKPSVPEALPREPLSPSFPDRLIRTKSYSSIGRIPQPDRARGRASSLADLSRPTPASDYFCSPPVGRRHDRLPRKSIFPDRESNNGWDADMAEVFVKKVSLYDKRMQEDVRSGINYLPKGESRPASVVSERREVEKTVIEVPQDTSVPARIYHPPGESELLKFMRRKLVAAAESWGKGTSWRDLFTKCDADFSGELTESSINKAVRVHLRIPTAVLSDQQVADFVREIDADESGSVSLKELIQFLEKAPVGSVEDTLEETIRKARCQAREQMHLTMSRVRRRMIAGMKANKLTLERLFGQFDKDRDGTLSLREFNRALRRDLKLSRSDASAKDVAAVFALLDEDGTGSIDIDELKSLIRPPRSGKDSPARG